jgi:hypothetical protein
MSLDGTEITVPIAKTGEAYRFGDANRCRGCPATIYWYTTPAGKRSPHDADGTPHWATCPARESFRRRA